jgi:16S rRNA (guanine966-N2)-methyltransferase
MREALFNALGAMLDLAGARVLDLYAGTGALGLEALSRGAGEVLLVEADPKVLRVLRDNIAALGLPGAAVRAMPVESLAATRPEGAFDVVLADPPYALAADRLAGVLVDLGRAGWLAHGAVVAVERASRSEPWRWPVGFEPVRDRRYGDTSLWYGERTEHDDQAAAR